MMSDLIRLFDQAITSAQDRAKRRGQIGRINATGGVTVNVPGRPGMIYVRLGDGSDGTIEAWPKNVARRAHVYVKVYTEDGAWVAEGDTTAIANGGGDAVAPHTHRRHSGNEYVMEAELFAPGLVLPSSGLTVSVGSFRYPNSASGETFIGATLDLTSVMPSTTGKWAWIVVGVDPDTNTAVAAASAEFDTQAELTRAEIDNVTFTGYIPLCAIQVNEADTALSDIGRYYDARTWFTRANNDDHAALTNIGSNTHAQIDTHITTAAAHIAATEAHGATGAVAGLTNVQTFSNKTFSDVITASGGITFGNETLAVYDEGTWTPAIDAVTSSPSVTYTTQSGRYTQIGRMVWVIARIVIATISGGSGGLRITGLPFTAANFIPGTSLPVAFVSVNLTDTPAGVTVQVIANTATCSLLTSRDNTSGAAEAIGSLTAGSVLTFAGMYEAA